MTVPKTYCLTARWNRKVIEIEEETDVFPSFSQFVKFLTGEANIACNPVISLQSLIQGEAAKPKYQQQSVGAKPLTTTSDERPLMTNSNERTAIPFFLGKPDILCTSVGNLWRKQCWRESNLFRPNNYALVVLSLVTTQRIATVGVFVISAKRDILPVCMRTESKNTKVSLMVGFMVVKETHLCLSVL